MATPGVYDNTAQTLERRRGVKELGLGQQDYVSSAMLKSWCERNRNHFYVPEWLLQEWGIPVNLIYSNEP